MAKYFTGHIPDHPAVEAKRPGMHLHPNYGKIKAKPLPLSTNNRAKLPVSSGGPGILNQNDTSTCEGHAHASGSTLRLALVGTPVLVRSPVGLILGAYMIDRVPNADGTLPPLIDQGTQPSSILSAWGMYGSTDTATWGQYPASSQTMYIDPAGTNPSVPQYACIEPKVEQLYAESDMVFSGAYFVKTSGLQKILDILGCLANEMPLSDAIPASGNDFQGYSGGILSATSGPVDHANLIVDYAWTGTQDQFTAWQGGASGLDQYLTGFGANSWGEAWGESDVSGIPGGMYRFNRSFFDQLQSPCSLDVSKAISNKRAA